METELTQRQWTAILTYNPSHFKGDDLPVEQISWNDCREYVKLCNSKARQALGGWEVAIPTEAQWEFARRAGKTDSPPERLDSVAWYFANSGVETHPVGKKAPNDWGFYDMYGNVSEMASRPENKKLDAPPSFVFCGGHWDLSSNGVLSANEVSKSPDIRRETLGVRLALVPER